MKKKDGKREAEFITRFPALHMDGQLAPNLDDFVQL